MARMGVSDLRLTGEVAQYGRGIVEDVSEQLVQSFADCLKAQLVATPEEAQAAVAGQAKPVGGLRAGARCLLAPDHRHFPSREEGSVRPIAIEIHPRSLLLLRYDGAVCSGAAEEPEPARGPDEACHE